MAVTPYCTSTNVERVYSTFGVTSATDDDFDGDSDDDIVDDLIEKATSDVNRYLFPRGYTVAVCAASTWVKWCTAVLACNDICRHRGNPIPLPLAEEAQRYRDALQAILDGNADLTTDDGMAPPSLDNSPTVSNLTVDGRYPRAKIRRVPSTSTGGHQTAGRKEHVMPEYFSE